MATDLYDIFAGTSEDDALWREAVVGLDQARERMREMATAQPDNYFIFHAENQTIVDRLCAEEKKKADQMKILIVDDHDAIRAGLRGILAAKPEWQVIGEAANGREAVEASQSLQPDLLLLDLSMPIMNGIEAARRILANNQKVRIIIFSMHESNGMLNEARRAGAQGYVRKSQASKDLLKAIETVCDGKLFFNTQKMSAACQ